MSTRTTDAAGVFDRYTIDTGTERPEKQLLPQFLQKREPLVGFFSLTWGTPNYWTLYMLEELARFSHTRCINWHIINWDIHPVLSKLKMRLEHMPKALAAIGSHNELIALLSACGVAQERVRIYNASELLRRLMSSEHATLALAFFKILSEVDTTKLYTNVTHTTNTQFVLPLRCFFEEFVVHFLSQLCPWSGVKEFDFQFMFEDKTPFYKIARQLMYEKGVIKSIKPPFVIAHAIPYFDFYHPSTVDWHMTFNEILSVVKQWPLTPRDALDLFEHAFKWRLQRCIILTNGGELRHVGYQRAVKELRYADDERLRAIVAHNLKEYMESFKQPEMCTQTKLDVTEIAKLRELAGVLRSRVVTRILPLCDGSLSVAQIARRLGAKTSNVSACLAKLKRLGLVTIEDKKVRRVTNLIEIKLDSIY